MRRLRLLIILPLVAILIVPSAGSPGKVVLSNTSSSPDFSLQCCFSVGDGTVQVVAGQTYSSWGWVYSLNNFAGSVSLSLTTPFPSSISPSVVLTAGSTGEPNIAITPSSSTAAGTYSGTITGTSGSLVHSISISIVVSAAPPPPQGTVCFSTSMSNCPSSPAHFSAPLGETFTAFIVAQGVPAFAGFNIWFQYPYGVLNATGVSIVGSVLPGAKVQFECVNGVGSSSCGSWLGNGPGIVALDATGNKTTAPTTGLLYSVSFKVTGVGSGNLNFFCVTSPSGPWLLNCAALFNGSNAVSVNVQGANFSTGPASGTTIPITGTFNFDHISATVNGTVTVDSTAKTITGIVSVVVTNTTNGQTIFSKTFTFSKIFGSSQSFTFGLKISILPIPLGLVCTLALSGSTVDCILIRDPDIAGNGVVSIVDVGIVFADFGSAIGSSQYNPSADLNATGRVDIVDLSMVLRTFDAPVFS